jgi:hypothetical protein
MRRVLAILTLAALGAVAASADFDGAFAPSLWTLSPGAGSGTLSATRMSITGSDAGVGGDKQYSITPAGGPHVVSFSWTYTGFDSSPGYDSAYYSINGAKTTLPGTSTTFGGASVSGSVGPLTIPAGRSFALGVNSVDGIFGPGVLNVEKWVPEPGTLSLLALGALAAIRRR